MGTCSTSGGREKPLWGTPSSIVWRPLEAVSHILPDIWWLVEAVSEDLCPTFGGRENPRGLVALGLATAGVCHGHLALSLAASGGRQK